LLIEVTYQYGDGSKNLNHKGLPLKEKGFEFIIDETQIKVVVVVFGMGCN
jgi:hypothetical protein